MAKSLSNWTLPAALYPLGTQSFGGEQKCAVMVWSSQSILHLIFKGLKNCINNNEIANKSFTVDLPAVHNIENIIVGNIESIILTANGNIFHYETSRTVKLVPYFDCVQSACTTSTGFALICLSENGKRQSILIHPDCFRDIITVPHMQKFDISFDEQFCSSTWRNTKFCIKELQPNVTHPAIFQAMRKRDEVYEPSDRFIFFSVDNSFLTLIWNRVNVDEDYHIQHIQTCSSNIIDFWQSNDRTAIYLLLESGAIEVLHTNQLFKMLPLLKRSILFFERADSIIVGQVNDDSFVYSNGFELCQIKIFYSPNDDSYKVSHPTVTQIAGVVGITFISHLKIIIAITENRFFYNIKFNCFADNICINTKMIEVTSDFMIEARKQQRDLIALTNTYRDVSNQITEVSKTNKVLIAFRHFRNTSHKTHIPFKATIKATHTVPVLGPDVIFSGQVNFNYNVNSYFIRINIHPNEYCDNKHLPLDFATNLWSLRIMTDSKSSKSIRFIRIINDMFKKPIEILFSMNKSIVPIFLIDLYTSVRIGNDFIAATFPIEIQQINIIDIMQIHNKLPDRDLYHTSANNTSKASTNNNIIPHLTYKFKLPSNSTITDLLKLFNNSALSASSEDCIYYINFLRHVVEMVFNENSKMLQLKCSNADVMYSIKEYLINELHEKYRTCIRSPINTTLKQIYVS